MQLLRIPYVVGYGMTECGPLISYKGWAHPMIGNSGGVAAPTIEARIDSPHPARIPGEIQVRGDVVTRVTITIPRLQRRHSRVTVG